MLGTSALLGCFCLRTTASEHLSNKNCCWWWRAANRRERARRHAPFVETMFPLNKIGRRARRSRPVATKQAARRQEQERRRPEQQEGGTLLPATVGGPPGCPGVVVLQWLVVVVGGSLLGCLARRWLYSCSYYAY